MAAPKRFPNLLQGDYVGLGPVEVVVAVQGAEAEVVYLD